MEHIPYKLIGPNVLKEGTASELNREEFFKKHVGEATFTKVQEAVDKWANEKGIPMYVATTSFYVTASHSMSVDQYTPRCSVYDDSRASIMPEGLPARWTRYAGGSPSIDLQSALRRW